MKIKMKINIVLLSILLIINIEATQYKLQIKTQESANIIVDNPYDEYGFDQDGNHQDGGEKDSEGFNKDGIKDDDNSSLNISLSQKLTSFESFNISQEENEGNFSSFIGTISFDKEVITLISQDNKTAYLKSEENNNAYVSGVEIIKNGNITNNTNIYSNFIHQEPIYEEQVSYYWTTPVNQGDVRTYSALSGNGSKSLTQSAATKKIGYTLSTNTSNGGKTKSYYRVAQNNHISYYEYNNIYRFRYYFTSWVSQRRTTTNNVLIGYNETNYSEFTGASIGDTIEILKPIMIQYSTNGSTWNDITTERTNILENKLKFSVNNVDTRNISFRILDSGHSYTKSTLNGFIVNFKNKRLN